MGEVSSLPEVMKGSVMHRLFQRAFPGFFAYNSLHLWQPFHIPAINYVLAKKQGKLADLEDLAEMGIDSETVKLVAKFVASDKESELTDDEKTAALKNVLPTRLKTLDSQIKPLKELEDQRSLGYTRVEVEQIRDIKLDQPDTYDFVTLQLAFKPLKRLVKMPDSRFNAPKATTVQVTNYSTIVDEILAKRAIYKNPGFLDYQSIPNGPLRAILAGKLDGDKELEAKVEAAYPMLRSLVTPGKEKDFRDYFDKAAQTYLSKGQRDYQMQKSMVQGKETMVQVWQIDIVSE